MYLNVNNKKTAGFTLIELVIVIIVLGILTVIAAPKFIGLSKEARGENLAPTSGQCQNSKYVSLF